MDTLTFIFLLVGLCTLINVGCVVACACILHAAIKLYSETSKQRMIEKLKREA